MNKHNFPASAGLQSPPPKECPERTPGKRLKIQAMLGNISARSLFDSGSWDQVGKKVAGSGGGSNFPFRLTVGVVEVAPFQVAQTFHERVINFCCWLWSRISL